jgi:hypothetical protein
VSLPATTSREQQQPGEGPEALVEQIAQVMEEAKQGSSRDPHLWFICSNLPSVSPRVSTKGLQLRLLLLLLLLLINDNRKPGFPSRF